MPKCASDTVKSSGNRFLDLPHELQGLIWRSYFTHHVGPLVRAHALGQRIRRLGIHVTLEDIESEGFEGVITHGELAGVPGVLWWFCPLVMHPYYFHEANMEDLIRTTGFKAVYRGVEQDVEAQSHQQAIYKSSLESIHSVLPFLEEVRM